MLIFRLISVVMTNRKCSSIIIYIVKASLVYVCDNHLSMSLPPADRKMITVEPEKAPLEADLGKRVTELSSELIQRRARN